MDILMVTHFITFPWEKGNSRFVYLANMLCKNRDKIEIVTTTFYHKDKKQREYTETEFESLQYKVTELYEPGYPKNVCLKRLRSHKVFARNLKKYLLSRRKPDIIYCAVPSLDAAYVAAQYCKKNKVPFIIDVQDLWPEAFQMVVDIPILSNIGFFPMKHRANKIYSSADAIIAVSRTYADRALRVNNKCKSASVVYLGTDKDYFDGCIASNPELHDEIVKMLLDNSDSKIRLAYTGTLGSSYDLTVIFDAMRKIDTNILNGIEFIVMGDGPRRAEFEEKSKGLPVIFTGSLTYSDMVRLLSHCDIGVNPIRKGAAQSIINKHMDYAMAGLAVINTQECQEYRNLLEEYKCGINCECGDSKEVASAIDKLVVDLDMRKSMGENSRRMGEAIFDRAKTYHEIVRVINDCNRKDAEN